MIGAIVHQLTRNLNDEQVREGGFAPYFVDHTTGVYPTAASGFPWNAASMAVKGDVICDLSEDMAAEQKARVTYDNILRMSDDPDVNNVIRFLREREIVHFQRFGEAVRLAKEKMDQKNVYFTNPALSNLRDPRLCPAGWGLTSCFRRNCFGIPSNPGLAFCRAWRYDKRSKHSIGRTCRETTE